MGVGGGGRGGRCEICCKDRVACILGWVNLKVLRLFELFRLNSFFFGY